MRNLKKLASLLLALVMVLSLTVTASAETIQMTGNMADGHKYKVYQIFTGDLAIIDGQKVLSNIKYGANYGTLGVAVPAEALAAIDDAAAFAKELMDGDGVNDIVAPNEPVATLVGTTAWTEAVPGYYLIVDDTSVDIEDSDAFSAYMIRVVEDVQVKPKAGVPTVDKEITADNNSIENDIASDAESNNLSIGSAVTYTLTSNVPAEASYYDYYYFIVDDTLSAGLTYNNDLVVTIGGKPATKGTDYAVYEEDVKDADNNVIGKNIKVALLDAKSHAGEAVVLTYTATLNENAVIGAENGNPNSVNVDFSNNPNYTYDGTNEPEKPGLPDSTKNIPTGETPTDTVRTFTTELKLKKVDESGNPLQGAEFEISGNNVKIVLVSQEKFTVKEGGAYYKLKTNPATYTTEEPIKTDSYEKAPENANAGYVKDGDTYRVATVEEIEKGVDLYIKIEANADLYDSTTVKYEKTIEYVAQNSEMTATSVKAFVGDDGILVFEGLGQGTYTIKETTTPAGYNTISDITVNITWAGTTDETDTSCDWTVEANGATVAKDGDVYQLTIVNKSGSTLPETGGMGTTLFYIAGGILVLAAVVLLVTKKRMQNAE